MRKTLLASAGGLLASAQAGLAQTSIPVTANPSQGQLAAPYGSGPNVNNNNNAWGIANTSSGAAAAGPISTIYPPNADTVPRPGTVVIRLNGRVEADVAGTFTSVDRSTPPGYKLNPVGIGSYMRLYPGFDGLSASGIRYGAAVELRENFAAGNAGSVDAPAGTGPAAGPSANTSSQTIYVRRAFTYLATDQAGLLRFGQGDGVLGLFDNCIFTSQCWDAGEKILSTGGLQIFAPGTAVVPFVWLDQSVPEYGNNKIVYLSPQVYGFDLGLQYAPSEGNAFQNEGSGAGCGQAAPGCISLSAGNDPTRWLNQVGVGLRWQRGFGPFDVKAYGFWETAGKEDLTTAAYAPLSPTGVIAGNAATLHYDNLNFYKAGVALSAYNITAAVDYIGGAINNALSMRPTGGAPMSAVLTGLTYANGPITLGADLGIIDCQGAAQLVHVSQEHQYEVAFGGNYKLAPGVQLVGAYTYIHRYQGDFNFATGTAGRGDTVAAQARQVLFGTVLTW